MAVTTSPTPTVCGCGCRFPLTPGMYVYEIAGVQYAQGCVRLTPVPLPAPAA